MLVAVGRDWADASVTVADGLAVGAVVSVTSAGVGDLVGWVTSVAVGGRVLVALGGSGVAVGGTGVDVGGTDVAVGGCVTLGGTFVSVGAGVLDGGGVVAVPVSAAGGLVALAAAVPVRVAVGVREGVAVDVALGPPWPRRVDVGGRVRVAVGGASVFVGRIVLVGRSVDVAA